MKQLLRLIGMFLLLLSFSGCVTSIALPVKDVPEVLLIPDEKLNGEWEGTIFFKDSISKMNQQVFHLTVDSAGVKFFEKNTVTGVWAETMPRLYQISRHGSNAVIQATDSGNDEDGNWVETWVLVVTRISINELKVEWVRMVNNVALPSSDPKKVFSHGGSGTFKRLVNE